MNNQIPVHMDKAAFLNWVERQDGRYELVEGRVIAGDPPCRAHALIATDLLILLSARLDRRQWVSLLAFGLNIGPETIRFPDMVVDRAGGDCNDRTATAPVLIAEVLSPSTAAIDLGDKAAEYLQLPSLAAYLVFSEDEPNAWVWIKGEQGFPPAPAVLNGKDEIIWIPALKLTLPLSALYASVELE